MRSGIGIVDSSHAVETGTLLRKGVAVVPDGHVTADMATLNASWWYDWSNPSLAHEDAPGFEYIPMMWGDWELEERFELGGPPSEAVTSSGILLGFNEPDEANQAAMTVARALELWPQLEATGARLGSPSPSTGTGGLPWLASFMAASPRVDFICAHWYQDLPGGRTFAELLDLLHTTYDLPIWVTEIGNLTGGVSANAALIPSVMTTLIARPWVERIAWFTARDNAGWAGTGLINTDGTLNAAGTVYAGYPATIVRPGPSAVGFEDDFERANGLVDNGWLVGMSAGAGPDIAGGLATKGQDDNFAECMIWPEQLPSDDIWLEVDVDEAQKLFMFLIHHDATTYSGGGGEQRGYAFRWQPRPEDDGGRITGLKDGVYRGPQNMSVTGWSGARTLRVECDPETMTFRFYADGTLCCTRQDTDAPGTWLGGPTRRYVGVQFYDQAANYARFRAIRAGTVSGTPPSAPGTPAALTATPASGQVGLTWESPTSGGSAITDYIVQYRTTAGPGAWTTFSEGVGTSTATTVTGLTNGTSYDFQVAAINAVGTGTYSVPVTATPAAPTAPGAPTGVGGVPGNTQVALTWTAPANNGGSAVTDYTVQYALQSAPTSWTTFTDAVSSANGTTVTGLTNGTSYIFRVAAVNAIGTGSYSTASSPVTPDSSVFDPTSIANLLLWYDPADATMSGASVTGIAGHSGYGPTLTPPSGGVAKGTQKGRDTLHFTGGAGLNGVLPATYASNVLSVFFAYKHEEPITFSRLVSLQSSDQADDWNNASSAALVSKEAGAIPGVNWNNASTPANANYTGVWYVGELIATATTLTMYVDGVQVLSTTKASTNLSAEHFGWGGRGRTESGDSYRGHAGEVLLYARALNSTERTNVRTYLTDGWIVPPSAPDAPTSVSGTPGDTSVGVSWTAPANNGGSLITDYITQYALASAPTAWTTFSDSTSTAPFTSVTGLTNDTAYIFRVAAVNAVGQGAYSSASASVTPVAGASGDWSQDFTTMSLGVLTDWTMRSGMRFGNFDFSGIKKCAVCHDGGYSYIDWYFSTCSYNPVAFSGQAQHMVAVVEFEDAGSSVSLNARGSATLSTYNGVRLEGNGNWIGLSEAGGAGANGTFTVPSFNSPFEVELTINANGSATVVINGASYALAVAGAFNRSGLYCGMQLASRAKMLRWLHEDA